MGRLPAEPGARALLVDPKQPRRVYAAGEGGVFRSDDAGQTWEGTAQGLPEGGVLALALDPRQPQRLFAAAGTGGIYLSEDGATTWRALPAPAGSG